MNNPVVEWFADSFAELHPMLQQLHRQGGTLNGSVELTFGHGIAGLIGRRLAGKMGMPTDSGDYPFTVRIAHSDDSLLWARRFDEKHEMVSVFTPHGHHPTGYWTESSGKLQLELGVRIIDGGWHWVQRGAKLNGLTLPAGLLPRTQAYKRIVDGEYEFRVAFSYPLLGELLCYTGFLSPEVSRRS